MLDVLLESRPAAPRRARSTLVSAALHAGLAAAAVAATMPGPRAANATATHEPPAIYVPLAPDETPTAHAGVALVEPPPAADAPLRRIVVPNVVPVGLPSIDVGPALPPDQIVIGRGGAANTPSIGGGDPFALPGADGVLDERQAERAPRVAGRALEPRYPSALRAAGIEGRVDTQFVVDTLGRAELDDFRVLEHAHPAFVEAVRESLAHYRFSPGEAGGRKVRTRVQMSFHFTIAR